MFGRDRVLEMRRVLYNARRRNISDLAVWLAGSTYLWHATMRLASCNLPSGPVTVGADSRLGTSVCRWMY